MEKKKALQVLVADGSSHSRLVLEEVLSAAPDLYVSGLAADGNQMLQLLHDTEADVVLVSVDIRYNNSLFAFKRIFSERPTPIVMLVAKEHLTLELVKEAIDLGVYSVVVKPGPGKRPNYRTISDEIIAKVRAVRNPAYRNFDQHLQVLADEANLVTLEKKKFKSHTADTIIVIGASTGGTQAVEQIVRQLDSELNAAVLIAIHMPPKFTHSYTRRLKELTRLVVTEGRTGIIPKPGKIIVAPGGRNMIVQSVMGNYANLRIGFTEATSLEDDTPSVDELMQTVAASAVDRVVGVILTGMGKDGTAGAGAIAMRKGGYVIAQNEESSAIFGMAKSAILSGFTNKVLPLSQIAYYLNRYVAEQQQVSMADNDT